MVSGVHSADAGDGGAVLSLDWSAEVIHPFPSSFMMEPHGELVERKDDGSRKLNGYRLPFFFLFFLLSFSPKTC